MLIMPLLMPHARTLSMGLVYGYHSLQVCIWTLGPVRKPLQTQTQIFFWFNTFQKN